MKWKRSKKAAIEAKSKISEKVREKTCEEKPNENIINITDVNVDKLSHNTENHVTRSIKVTSPDSNTMLHVSNSHIPLSENSELSSKSDLNHHQRSSSSGLV